MRVALCGAGWVTAAAKGRGKDAGAFVLAPGSFPEATARTRLEPPYPRFGRMDDYSKAAFIAVVLALEEAGLDRWKRKRSIGIIASTRTGCLKTDLDYLQDLLTKGGASASPQMFAYTLPSTFIGDASIHLGLAGPGFIVQEEHPLSLTGLALAVDAVLQGEARQMVVGACDAGIPPFADSPSTATPYAVFLVLGKPVPGLTSYGDLAIKADEKVSFCGKAVCDLLDILRACQSHRSGGCPEPSVSGGPKFQESAK